MIFGGGIPLVVYHATISGGYHPIEPLLVGDRAIDAYRLCLRLSLIVAANSFDAPKNNSGSLCAHKATVPSGVA